MIQAITNQQVGLNVVTELISGYALPGRPIAMMMFKVSIISLSIWRGSSLVLEITDMGLHHNGAGIAIHFGLQARSLHEDSLASDVLVPGCGNCHRWYCAACRPGLYV